MKKGILILLLLFMFALTTGYAQISPRVFGAIAIPSGDFADDDLEDFVKSSGLAKMGFAAGIDLNFPLGSPGLYGIASASFIMNGFDTGEIEDIYDGYNDVDISASKWKIIPLMGGLKYETNLSPTLKGYGIGLAGISFVMSPKIETDLTFEESDYSFEFNSEITFDKANTFSFAFGGGLVINDKINIGFRYFILSEIELEGEEKSKIKAYNSNSGESYFAEDENDIEKDQPISFFLLTLWINF